MKNLFASLVLITLATASYSATVYTTANTGTLNWSEISWTATGTGAPRTWIVPSELTATINTNITLEDSLKVAGVLNFKSNTSLTMNTNGYITLFVDGKITGGSGNTSISFGNEGIISGPYNGAGAYAGPSYANKSTNDFIIDNALPVTWNSFTSLTLPKTIQLNWSTASELNNSHFEIERAAADGIFHTIGSASGNATTQTLSFYTFTDTEPIKQTAYYRIKQIDFNGDFDYSSTIKISYQNNTPITVWPTIIKNNTINVKNISENAIIKMIDATGKEISGLNFQTTVPETVTLKLQNTYNKLNGFYFLYITDNDTTEYFKILIQ